MFRILALDGGGIKGTFTASVLAALEEETGKSIVEHFDLIAGTSTGGILAIGLGLGLSAKDLLEFYLNRGSTIFPSTSMVEKPAALWRRLFRPKHSHEVLRHELTEVLKNRKFGESKTRLVIPTYDAFRGRIFVMKTAHHARFTHDVGAPAVDVALATSAAPTYFAAAPFPHHADASYVDGGVWANCPALVGVVEALSFLAKKADEIDVLAVGTTTEPYNIATHIQSGLVQWNVGVISLMFAAQMEAALAQAALLVQGRLHHINVMTLPGQYAMDNARPTILKQLAALGRGEAVRKENLDVVRTRFLNGTPAPAFAPVL